jgi:hypothetical protein
VSRFWPWGPRLAVLGAYPIRGCAAMKRDSEDAMKAGRALTNRCLKHALAARVFCLVLAAAGITAHAQFKVVEHAPFPPNVARQKIKTLLEGADPANSRQTVDSLMALLPWYRDIINEELISAWKSDGRANLPEVIRPLADEPVAKSVVEFSWREGRTTAFTLAYAPMLGDLMARYPESAKPFLDDLLGPATAGGPMPALSLPEAETVCRILVDMPSVGAWESNARKILPYYRSAAQSLLSQDLQSSDREKWYRAQQWLDELKIDEPQPAQRRVGPSLAQRPAVDAPPVADRPAAPLPASPETPATLYKGAMSGTLTCSGSPIPRNAEYVFRNLPANKLALDYDTRNWDARLAPGEGGTQKLILKNKSPGPQKQCVVHWTAVGE